MGGVPSLDRGEIVVFNLGPPGIASTPVEKLLGDTGVINVLKVPKVRNENWERAKPAFKPLLEEALQIRADIRKKKDTADNDKVYFGGFGSKLEAALGMTRKSTEYYASKEELWASMENTPGGWLDRANTTLGEYGLQCFLDRIPRDGDAIYFAIVDPQSPEELPPCGPHDCCCGLC